MIDTIPNDKLKHIADELNTYDLNNLQFDKWNGQSFIYLVVAAKYIDQTNKWTEYNNVLEIMKLTEKYFSEHELKDDLPCGLCYILDDLRQLLYKGGV